MSGSFKVTSHLPEKSLCHGVEGLAAVPDEVEFGFETRRKRTEGEATGFGDIDEIAERQLAAEAFFHEEGSIVGQAERTFKVELIKAFAGPSLNIALPSLFGSKKRQADQIVDREFFFGRER